MFFVIYIAFLEKYNKNIIVFVVSFLFLVFGFSGKVIYHLGSVVKNDFVAFRSGKVDTISTFSQDIEKSLSSSISYHDQLMDVNSIKENMLGTRIFKNIVKADSGNLIGSSEKQPKSTTHEIVIRMNQLFNVCKENDVNFLYCAAPDKQMYEKSPVNAHNYYSENYTALLSEMQELKIPFIDFTNYLNSRIKDNELFFATDHHWTPKSGFIAAESICKELKNRYGFEYNSEYTNINNYNIKTYKNWFLGSQGKSVGKFFTWKGADDFDLITPKFQTDMTEEQPYKNEIKNGDFKDTVLFTENLKKDYYNINTYATYSGGDFRLQIMKNNLNKSGKKVVIIRDSFAIVVAPFLSLNTSELHVCDMRNFEYYVGEKLNIKDYIQQIKPDYLLVLFSGTASVEADGRYDFF